MYFYFSKILAPFLNLTNILFVLLIFFFVIIFRFKIRYKFLFNIIIVLLIFISFLPIGRYGLKFLEKDFIYQFKIKKVDNIFVLAGSEVLEATEISKKINLNDNGERLIASVKLALEFQNAKVIYIGGDGNLKKNTINEVDVAKIFFKDVGFDLNRVEFIGNTRNTIENLKEIKKKNISNQNNVLITSAFHMKRSMLISDKLNLKLVPYAVDFKSIASTSIFNYFQRFDVAENLRLFNIFFREMVGIVVFKVIY